ncbi:MAG: sialate O-acetylesterase [Fidelibacterota bacterium]
MIKRCLISIMLLAGFYASNLEGNGGPVLLNDKPVNNQLYTRDYTDSARVFLNGTVVETGYDSIALECYKNDTLYNTQTFYLSYLNNQATFSFECLIHAELSTYDFSLHLISDVARTPVWSAENIVCGDAFILTGQSNSHYAFVSDTWQNTYCRTFGVKTTNSNYDVYNPADTLWTLSHASSSTGPNVGSMGLALQRKIMEEEGIPTCLFNGGTGGSSISEHFKNEVTPEDLNTIYGKLLYRIRKSGVSRIRAILWHQGENDADLNPALAYPERFSRLIHAWQEDFAPERYYVYQLRPGGPGTAQGLFREMQRTLPDSFPEYDLEIIATCGLPGYDGLHFNYDGYMAMADRTFYLLRADFYHALDTPGIHSPDIQHAVYDHTKQQVILVFDENQSLLWPDPVGVYTMEDYFLPEGDRNMISQGEARGDSLILTLRGPNFISYITYLPDDSYFNSIEKYQGPWINNTHGNSALSFHEFPVEHADKFVKITAPNGGEIWSPGAEQNIEWISEYTDSVCLEYSMNDGADWQIITHGLPAEEGVYLWQVPKINSETCRIRIRDLSDSLIADESNMNFSIIEQSVTLLTPNGGELFTAGDTITISWISAYVENVKLEYSIDGGTDWNTIRYRVEAFLGTYDWIAPEISSAECLVRILDRDSNAADTSDAAFTIQTGNGIHTEVYPETFILRSVYPNPFNPQTTIHFFLPEDCHLELCVFDVKGEQVITLANDPFEKGTHSLVWNASKLSSGIYVITLHAGNRYVTQKCVLIK